MTNTIQLTSSNIDANNIGSLRLCIHQQCNKTNAYYALKQKQLNRLII